MKTLNKVFIAAIAATAMTACNNELGEQFVSNNGGDVKFTMGIEGTSASRVAMEDGSYQASFENENKVGVFVKEVDSYSNLEYTFDGNAWNGATIKVPADKVYTYYAYYPYAESATSTAVATEVNADQETGGYLANDYLMANLTAESGQANVNLQFTHALSLVEVTLSGPNAAEDAVVTLSNMTTDATMNLEASTVTPGEKKANVTMDKLTTSMKYRAIVPEQTVAQGTALMTIVSKGRTYKVSYKASDVKFERGKYISLNVELGSSSSAEDVTVTITSQGITNWGKSDEVTGDASVSVAGFNIPLPVDGKFEVFEKGWSNSTVSSQIPAGGTDKWYVRDNVADSTKILYSYSGENAAIEFKSQTYTIKTKDGSKDSIVYSRGAWNNDCAVFHSVTPLDTVCYKLSFKVLSTTDGSGEIGVTIASSNDNKLFAIHKDDGAFNGRSITTFTKIKNTDWEEKSVLINLARCTTSGKSSGLLISNFENTSITDVNEGVNIIFYNYTNGFDNSLYLKDIKLEQYTGVITWKDK